MTRYEKPAFSEEEINSIRSKFAFITADYDGRNRLYFDNAGGSLRLISAEKRFHEIDLLPNCSEHSDRTSKYLESIEQQGMEAILRVIFNASHGVIYPGFTASQIMMDAVRVISANAKGTNYVTTALEHPSSFDSIEYYSKLHNCEMRVAQPDKDTGGVTPDAILKLVDENTAILSVMASSNFSGYVHDVETIFKRAKEINPDIFIICDAVQHAPHAVLDPEAWGVDVMNIAPYKFFGIRGFGVAYISDRIASFPHHKLLGKPADDWSLGSPAPAHLAAIIEIVNYVAELGKDYAPENADRRTSFVFGMNRIAAHERYLLNVMLEGTNKAKGLRHIPGVTVRMDNAPLEQRDPIIAIEFDNIPCERASGLYEKHAVVAFERSLSSIYSKRMLEAIGSKGVVRISPLHVNTVEEIEQFLRVTKVIASSF